MPAGQKPCSRSQDYATDLHAFVGANLFAKALFLTQEMYRLHRPLREQVRSYARRAEALKPAFRTAPAPAVCRAIRRWLEGPERTG
ncbi:hypothetical protein F4W67_22445 [Pseudomonas caricapapayae]|nr:hypothetical protein F4W67_22445 [Pseudomonas caricapapayae]